MYNIKLEVLIMSFIKKLEFGLEPMIYLCEHQSYYNALQWPSVTPWSQFPCPGGLGFGMEYSMLMEQVSGDLKNIMERISANNRAISSSIHVPPPLFSDWTTATPSWPRPPNKSTTPSPTPTASLRAAAPVRSPTSNSMRFPFFAAKKLLLKFLVKNHININ